MKSSFVAIAIALFAFTFTGCTENPTSLTSSDLDAAAGTVLGKKPAGTGGGGGGSTSTGALVDLAEGMSALDLRVKINSDSNTDLSFNSDQRARGTVAMQFTASAGNCVLRDGDPAVEADLLAQLTATPNDAGLWVEVDKTALGAASSGNHLEVNYADPSRPHLGTIRLGIPSHGDPAPTVHDVSTGGTTRNYRFSGGVVRVWATMGKGNKDDAKLFCSNGGDTVLVTVDPA